ncbi:MAG TPA: phosphotransferase [Thermoanaerobaculia bacterium]|nr:phosphotransferase [Thermoanaerobaculia bacterium]
MTGMPPELEHYLRESLGERLEIEPLAGDASTRAYYRIRTSSGDRFMVAYYPDSEREALGRFVQAWEAISHHAPVPRIVHHGACAIVQQDVGDVTLFELLETDPQRALKLYRRAIDLVAAFQKSPAAASRINPPFTTNQFFTELAMTREFWVERMCGESDPAILEKLDPLFLTLAEAVASHPYVLCHRDFHGQNLHVIKDDIYLIDYQDLRMGPDTYDLASLLRDRGVARALGEDAERDLIEYYRGRAKRGEGTVERYYETLLQRSIKIVGTFAKQSITRGRHHYLAYIPPTLESIRLCIGQLPRYRELLDLFPTEPSLEARAAVQKEGASA